MERIVGWIAELGPLGADMKTPQKLGLVAVVVFIISHFLPAYGDAWGFACFRVCWNMLLGRDAKILAGAWFYYSGFAASNILFPLMVVLLFITKKGRRVRAVISVVFCFHVLSWVVVHIFGKPSEIAELKIGYYVWLTAYGLLVAAHLWKEPSESLESIRAPSSSPM